MLSFLHAISITRRQMALRHVKNWQLNINFRFKTGRQEDSFSFYSFPIKTFFHTLYFQMCVPSRINSIRRPPMAVVHLVCTSTPNICPLSKWSNAAMSTIYAMTLAIATRIYAIWISSVAFTNTAKQLINQLAVTIW